MKTFDLQEDVNILCNDVPTFPDGIPDAFDKLSKMLPTIDDRVFYGISYMDDAGKIIYKAAVSSNSDAEAEKYNCEPFTITKGEYLTETIMDWRDHICDISTTFQAIINDDRIEKNAVCVEWYKTDTELMCMVKTR